MSEIPEDVMERAGEAWSAAKMQYDGPIVGSVDRAIEAIAQALLSERNRALKEAGWQPIETAPHEKNVLMAWRDATYTEGWQMQAGMASWGWRRGGVSNMSEHGQATHWMPLPPPPAILSEQGDV